MEKLYSKSIFTLSSFFSQTSPLILLDPNSTSIPISTQPAAPIDDSSSSVSKEKGKLFCNTCNVGFEEIKDQHTHYKSEWHRFNLKLRLAGANAIEKEEFEALGEVSGSSSESSEEEGEDKKREKYLKKESKEIEEANEMSSSGKPGVAKSNKLAFLASKPPQKDKEKEIVVISLWRCLVEEGKKPVTAPSALSLLQTVTPNQKWIVLLCSGGRFAGAVFSGNNCVDHKAMHRYTVRKKQGGSQSSRDASGNAPKSAGASLRRYNETRLREDIVAILQSWKDHFATSEHIFYFAPKGAPRSMLLFEGSPVDLTKLRKIPIPIRRPTFLETKYVHQSLSTIDFFKPVVQNVEAIPETENISKVKDEKVKKVEQVEAKKERAKTPPPKKQEDPIYAPIREGKLEDIKKLLEGETQYELSIPDNADEVLTPLFVALSLKNNEIFTYLLNNPITNAEINVGIPAHNFFTALHLAASEGDIPTVKLLLEAGADPTSKDINSKTPYDIAKNKETRLAMRTFAGKNLDKWDYNQAHADVKEQLKKKSDKLKKKKQAQKAKKETDKKEKEKNEAQEKQKQQEEEAKKIEKESKQVHDAKVKTMSDREKRAMAAEQRMNAAKGIFVTCGNCKKEIVGMPFERLEFKYCTTKCVVEHKKIIGR